MLDFVTIALGRMGYGEKRLKDFEQMLSAVYIEFAKAFTDDLKDDKECVYTVKEPIYEMYYTHDDVIAVAKMLYGESRGCSIDNQQKAVWCVLNRVDADDFPDTIIGVLSQPDQFHGYSTAFPVWDELTAVAEDVLTRWSLEKQGVAVNRELPKSFLYFTGTGRENIFREAY